MKKLNFIFTGVFLSVMLLLSCSNNDEKPEIQQEAKSTVVKTARMLSFESALKDFYESKAENNTGVSHKNSTQVNLEVQNQAIALLKELGINQNDVEANKATSNDILVYFALNEYSKRLSQLYNQSEKTR